MCVGIRSVRCRNLWGVSVAYSELRCTVRRKNVTASTKKCFTVEITLLFFLSNMSYCVSYDIAGVEFSCLVLKVISIALCWNA